MDEFAGTVIDPIAILKQADGLNASIAEVFSKHIAAE